MTLRLTIDEHAWRAHVTRCRASCPELVPVVKGNGYGFGRQTLTRTALSFADQIAVGTVHELTDVGSTAATHPSVSIVALTPAVHLPAALPPAAVPTIGSLAHLDALRRHGWRGGVAVKLESTMHRHGVAPEGLALLQGAIAAAGCDLRQYVLHLPLASATFTPADAVDEIERWLTRAAPLLDPAVPVSVSHLPAAAFRRLCDAHPGRTFRLRSGTGLWHGDKTFLHLSADVLEVRRVGAGEPLGYRRSPAPAAGHLVIIGAGSAHGVVPLEHGLSPYHHARQRLALVEPPHMHTSMALVTNRAAVPSVGEWIDVQRPLISVSPDELDWR